MSDPLQWLQDRAAQPGTLAGALRLPDGTVLSHSADQACPSAAAENILANFDTLMLVAGEPVAPQWSTWSFEEGHIRLVERPDGWRLALVVRGGSAAWLDSLSQEFLADSFVG